ncbi:MAG TPA: dephospho-CoA kinase, partial [Gemmatimonadales bacterium]|nr:dephospho-CoA kinase [Gemmatimonadales bacterium]
MLSVALNGNIASGKSIVAEFFRHWGATVIDADALVRELQAKESPLLARIAARFGPGILRADGELDRAALRTLVLADPAALADLNALVHPEVERRRAELVEEARERGDAIVVSDIPLLFEAGRPEAFDAVVLVDAPEPIRLERLVRFRGLDRETASAMIAAQAPAGPKRAR